MIERLEYKSHFTIVMINYENSVLTITDLKYRERMESGGTNEMFVRLKLLLEARYKGNKK